MSNKDPFSDVSKRRETRLQAFRDFFSGKKSKPKLGTSDGKGLGTSNGKGLGSSGGLSYGSLEETRNLPDVGEVRLSPVHEHVADAENIVGEAEFHQARPFSDKKGQRVAGEFMPYREEHEPYGLRDDGIICISKAYLYEIHPTNETLIRHELSPLEIGVGGSGVVYSTYKTDDHGKVKVEEPEEEGGESPPAYILGFDGELPPNTDYVLPDESGSGSDGEYYIPICYIKDSKLEAKQFQDGRQALMRGALEGHRGPLWWIAGYDAIKNVGSGQAVYKDYTEGDDFKNLRRISEKGQDRNCEGDNKISGLAQVKVGTDGDTINVHGNRYNKTWKVGDKKQAIVEDGLVRCLSDLPVQELEPVTVITGYASSSSSVTAAAYPTASDKVNVLTSSGTPVSAAPPHGESDRAAAWSGGDMATNAHTGGSPTDVVATLGTSDAWTGGTSTADNVVVSVSVVSDYARGGTVNAHMIQGTPHSTMWAGGTKKSLEWVEICVSSGSTSNPTTTCYWVLGYSQDDQPSEPDIVSYVDDPTQVTGVTSAVQITGVAGSLSDPSNSISYGDGVESRVLGQGIIGTDIDENPFYNSVATTASVVSGSTTVPVITGANYEQKFLKGEASPVSIPVAGSPVSVIKGSLPSVSISVPVATGTAEVYESAGYNLRVVKESTGDGCDSCPTE